MLAFLLCVIVFGLQEADADYVRGEIGLCHQVNNRWIQVICKLEEDTEEEIKECVNCLHQLGNRQTPQGIKKCKSFVPKRYTHCVDLMKMTSELSWPELLFNVSRIYFRLAGMNGDACSLLNNIPVEVLGAVMRNKMDQTLERLEDDQELMDMGMDFMRIGINLYDIVQPLEQFLKDNKYDLIGRLCRLPMNIGGSDQYEKSCRLCAFGVFKVDVPSDEVVESDEDYASES